MHDRAWNWQRQQANISNDKSTRDERAAID